jgi:cytidylate kinase
VGIPKRTRLIIGIDGPSGAGKSTVARALARRLGYTYIDTGAMYRAVALRAREKGLGVEDEEALSQLASSLAITFCTLDGENRVLCNGQDITQAIRSPEISLLASDISKQQGVREALVRMQRAMGSRGGIVLEGRDIGTVVFPEADVKFYLDAQAEERARRRHHELVAKGVEANFDETLRDVIRRDENDMGRSLSPLRKAKDAEVIDSTNLSVDQVVEALVKRVMEKDA